MKVSHRFNWHYAPPIYPDGDTQLWCKWCGFRETVKRRGEFSRDLTVTAEENEAAKMKRA
jgi:hypothetical protein